MPEGDLAHSLELASWLPEDLEFERQVKQGKVLVSPDGLVVEIDQPLDPNVFKKPASESEHNEPVNRSRGMSDVGN